MTINEHLLLDQLQSLGISLSLQVEKSANGFDIILSPKDFYKTNGFNIKSTIGWKSVVSRIVFGSYSLPLVKALGQASSDKRQLSLSFAQKVLKKEYILDFRINGDSADLENSDNWPTNWSHLNIQISSKPFDTEKNDQLNDAIYFQQKSILLIIIALMDLSLNDDLKTQSFEFEELPEGARTTVLINKYERDPRNRTSCVEYYGAVCQVCGFDFEQKYGAIGKGFIHVHHTMPLSMMGGAYKVDPIKDLIPVCPNCHYMLHKKNPPIAVDDLAQILALKK
jgi:5-methylcytosine-specific restriction protein A